MDARSLSGLGVQLPAIAAAAAAGSAFTPERRSRSMTTPKGSVPIIGDDSSDDEAGLDVGPPAAGVTGRTASVTLGPGGTWATSSAKALPEHPPSSRLANRPGVGSPATGSGWNANATDGPARPGNRRVGSFVQPPSAAALPPPMFGGNQAADGSHGNSGSNSPAGGRRAVSAQTTIRAEGTPGAPHEGALQHQHSIAAPGSFKPKSPPWPKATFSQRAQSGPARISTEELARVSGNKMVLGEHTYKHSIGNGR